MTWRIVVIDHKAKLSYKNNYLIVRGEEINMIHLSEINTIVVNSTATVITSYLISELLSRKIKLIFCDSQRNPAGEMVPYYGCHNSSKKISEQISWDKDALENIWTRIIKEKIKNQMQTLKKYNNENYKMLEQYLLDVKNNDVTNREGHSAKVYFDSMFGIEFTRDQETDINAALNYGYAILLSQFNREIVASGYLTQLGMKHKNEFNPFNLSSDLMEPFRPLVDCIVKDSIGEVFGGTMKLKLIDVLNQKVSIKNSNQFVSNAISIYVKSVFEAISKNNPDKIEFFKYEF